MKNRLLLAAALALGLLNSASAAAETYKIDSLHSTVSFTIRHLVSKFTGGFTKVTGTIVADPANLEQATVEATVSIGSINTADDKRNAHVLSPDFLDGAKFPNATFKSTAWKKTGEDAYDVMGNLTIKEVTKPVVLKVKVLGFGAGMGGAQISGWEATTTIKKSEFGAAGPAMLGKALGDEVTISIGIEAGYKPAASAKS
jgi:polyisoprenoid-binding protein YceI